MKFFVIMKLLKGVFMKKVSRPFLLTGLILSLVSFVIYTVISFLSINILFTLLTSNYEILQTAAIITIGVAIILLVLALLGIIFSSVSLARVNYTPEQFENKKGLIITSFVFNIIFCVFLVFGLVSEFNVLSLIILLVLICSSVFIMIDISKNKKHLANQIAETEKQPEIKEENQDNKKSEEIGKAEKE